MAEGITPLVVDEAVAKQHAGLRTRLGVALGLAGALVSGVGCNPEMGNTNPLESPEPAVSEQGPDRVTRPHLPALEGPLTNSIIIATVAGDETSRGFTTENTTALVLAAQQRITEATAGEIAFTQPAFLGKIAVTVPHPEDLCKLDYGLVPNLEFTTNFRAAVLAAAVAAGYDAESFHNPGLTIFANYECADPMRSTANNTEFSPKNSVVFTRSAEGKEPVQVLTHEYGHILGLAHGNRYICKGLPRIASVEDSCPDTYEYFDFRSILGGAGYFNPDDATRFNGYQQYRLGVLDEEQIVKIEKPGEYEIDLSALQPGQDGKQLVRIPRAVDPQYRTKNVEDYYWIELSPGGCPEQTCPLSVVLYTANAGNSAEATSTTLIPLTPKGVDDDKAYDGVRTAQPGQLVFADEATGLSLTIEIVEDAGDGSGHAKIKVALR